MAHWGAWLRLGKPEFDTFQSSNLRLEEGKKHQQYNICSCDSYAQFRPVGCLGFTFSHPNPPSHNFSLLCPSYKLLLPADFWHLLFCSLQIDSFSSPLLLQKVESKTLPCHYAWHEKSTVLYSSIIDSDIISILIVLLWGNQPFEVAENNSPSKQSLSPCGADTALRAAALTRFLFWYYCWMPLELAWDVCFKYKFKLSFFEAYLTYQPYLAIFWQFQTFCPAQDSPRREYIQNSRFW